MDWSADYRVFENKRVDVDRLFTVSRQAVLEELQPNEPLMVNMDDTLTRKSGRKVAGTSYWRDPLGPPFHTNFVWGQRFLQLSAALPEQAGASRARAIPIDFHHCPVPRKPKKTASEEEWQEYRQLQRQMKISQQGVDRLHQLRSKMNEEDDNRERRLIAVGDGGYTNQTVLKNLPPNTTFIGRMRRDAKLFALPNSGGNRRYGKRLQTPEAIRKDESIPWQTVKAFAAGKIHDFQIKTIAPVRSKMAGGKQNVRIVIIRPLAYRLTARSRLLYRRPVYLICTDPDLPLEKLVQGYVWRNEIELNFREEKTLLGAGQPQVRSLAAVETAPAFIVASYAMLLIAIHRSTDIKEEIASLLPKWRTSTGNERPSTQQAIGLLRSQLWGLVLNKLNFDGFVNNGTSHTKPSKFENSLDSAIIYASQ